jgi:hypothetical protein
MPIGILDLIGLKRLDHAMFRRHAAYPFVGLYSHFFKGENAIRMSIVREKAVSTQLALTFGKFSSK